MFRAVFRLSATGPEICRSLDPAYSAMHPGLPMARWRRPEDCLMPVGSLP
ncbi:hypothetical protein FQN60_011438 [Etheostoma spectabile]|uniref:Uncharacterized protein n=1 Tax=Etheostoma spectabile TaxID=54343 RepID=A0A5J5DRQ9_9PERO|nr:hypothetical protein FQN60_011438 [Etheostoma spectabile]